MEANTETSSTGLAESRIPIMATERSPCTGAFVLGQMFNEIVEEMRVVPDLSVVRDAVWSGAGR
jgi:hypothetical protein